MRGELGINIEKIRLREYKGSHEIIIYDTNGDFLIICGDNDGIKLFSDALDNVEDYEKILKAIF